MVLASLQALLSEFYDLPLSHDIYDFLITDEMLAGALDGGGRPSDEKLLIHEQGDEAQVSLYLNAGLVERLVGDDPTKCLSAENLADFWLAFEGVSHFTYYAYRAEMEKPVTLLEMELQAEVDKFVATAMLLHRQGVRPPRGLHHWQFALPSFDASLSLLELERYEYANYYAARYCAALWPRLAKRFRAAELGPELRRFYRYSQPAKIDHILARA
jgi:hypothetical protein